MKDSKPYGILAKYYDDFAGKSRYEKWRSMIIETASKYRLGKSFAIDLACGTGRNSESLKKAGFKRVVGIDISDAMLKQAAAKHPGIEFLKKSFLDFPKKSLAGASMVTCLYDSLNYLLDKRDLEKAFKNVYETLENGGVFLFDLNTSGHIKGMSSQAASVFTNDDIYVIMDNSCKGNRWFLDLSIFVKNEDDSFSLFRERHVERAYDEEEVVKLLEKIGFSVSETRHEHKKYSDGAIYNNRIYYIANKKYEKKS